MCKQACWDCKKATGGCSWVDDFKPIEGWDARPTIVDDLEQSYEIKSCPEFERDDIQITTIPTLLKILNISERTFRRNSIASIKQMLQKKGFELFVYFDEEQITRMFGVRKAPHSEILKTG